MNISFHIIVMGGDMVGRLFVVSPSPRIIIRGIGIHANPSMKVAWSGHIAYLNFWGHQ